MSSTENKQVVISLKDGSQVEGTISNVDKVKLIIQLINVKKVGLDGKEELMPSYDLNKADIKEIRLIQLDCKIAESENINAIPQNKKISTIEGFPVTSHEKAYDKNKDFFDSLKTMSHPEAREESKNYNQKNRDTFQLTNQESQEDSNKKVYYNNRGRGGYYNRRGGNRGGYHRGGYHNNNRGGYNNYNNYQQNNNYNNYNNYNQGYNNNNYRGRGGRGRGRGRGYNNYKQNNNYNNQPQQNNQTPIPNNNNNEKPAQ